MFEQISDIFETLVYSTGLYQLTLGHVIMIIVGLFFVYLAIVKHYEPYELLPIGLGAILINLPGHQVGVFADGVQSSGLLGILFHYMLYMHNILPPLIFLGLGALTDFGPLIAMPRLIMLGAASQIGIFVAFLGAVLLGFDLKEAASIGIIGGADGPTTIFLSAKLAPHILGVTAVTAYSYMGLVPLIQPPIMRLLTTRKERLIRMKQPEHVSRRTRILFPLIMMISVILLVPLSAPLVSMFFIGNMFRESGVVERLSKSAQNELLNIVTIALMLSIGITLKAENILNLATMKILILGLVAFSCGTAGGILFVKFLNLFSKEKINPLVGSAGVSAVPMAARVSQEMALKEDPTNHIIMHAMGPNVAGVIGSAIAAGVLLSILGS